MSQETYRKQLNRLARAMERATTNAVSQDLSPDSSDEFVKMFAEGNMEKRLEKLEGQLEFVVDAFEDFEQLAIDYIKSTRSVAYDSALLDGERMLTWLLDTRDVTPEQRDYIACQRARHRVEETARSNRMKLVRFQELRSMAKTLQSELEANDTIEVHLNPIRTWACFHTSVLLDEDTGLPANVLFFGVDGEVSSAFLELEGQALINELEDFQPCSLSEWAMLSQLGDREELTEFVRDLAELGLVAFS